MKFVCSPTQVRKAMLWVTLVVKNIQTRASLQICPMTSLNTKERKKPLHYALKTITRDTLLFSCCKKRRAISEDGLSRRLPLDCSFRFSTSDHKFDRAFGSNLWPYYSPTAQNQHYWLMVSKCFGPATVTVPHNWIYVYQKDGGWHYRMAKYYTKLDTSSCLKSGNVWPNNFCTLVHWTLYLILNYFYSACKQSQNFSFGGCLTCLLERKKFKMGNQNFVESKTPFCKTPDFILIPRKIPKRKQTELNSTHRLCHRIPMWLLWVPPTHLFPGCSNRYSWVH